MQGRVISTVYLYGSSKELCLAIPTNDLVIMGIPIMTMELAVGRASGLSVLGAYKKLEKPKSKWHIHGIFCMIGNYMLMMYYTTVSGWMLNYFCKYAVGQFEGIESDAVGNVFTDMLQNPLEMGLFMALMVVPGFVVYSSE